MPDAVPVREAPASLLPDQLGASFANQKKEPVLRIGNIQGNILAGFNKDHQTLLFLRITSPEHCKRWLRELTPFIATVEEVLAFNRLFKTIRKRRGTETRTVEATWLNIAFSFSALKTLNSEADAFRDAAFRNGMAAQSAGLGDPTNPVLEGCPQNWVVGGSAETEAHIVLLVASDDRNTLSAEVARLEDGIYAPRAANGNLAPSGVQVIYKQHCATLPSPLTGHEHFGFLDGVSQPGIRGLLSERKTDVLTRRQNPADKEQGKPGQDLLWPGEFVFGYQGQDPNGTSIASPGPEAQAGPTWGDDGSFLVIRRLRQDVPKFQEFLKTKAPDAGLTAEQFGAKCVGRWPSGAPVLRAPNADNRQLGDDDCANNHFEFQGASKRIHRGNRSENFCEDIRPDQSPGDKTGQRCPFAGHIRKAYPRDDVSNSSAPPSPYAGASSPLRLDEIDTQTHRLLRRGIPFGSPYPLATDAPVQDSGDRGLLFMAYQTSIVRQFEFVTQKWVNNPNFKDIGAGHDPILGQNGNDGQKGNDASRTRHFQVLRPDGSVHVVTATDEWVIPTGGGYFFAPSISALAVLSA